MSYGNHAVATSAWVHIFHYYFGAGKLCWTSKNCGIKTNDFQQVRPSVTPRCLASCCIIRVRARCHRRWTWTRPRRGRTSRYRLILHSRRTNEERSCLAARPSGDWSVESPWPTVCVPSLRWLVRCRQTGPAARLLTARLLRATRSIYRLAVRSRASPRCRPAAGPDTWRSRTSLAREIATVCHPPRQSPLHGGRSATGDLEALCWSTTTRSDNWMPSDCHCRRRLPLRCATTLPCVHWKKTSPAWKTLCNHSQDESTASPSVICVLLHVCWPSDGRQQLEPAPTVNQRSSAVLAPWP